MRAKSTLSAEHRVEESSLSTGRQVLIEKERWERAVRIVEQSASRIVRKEVAVVNRLFARCGVDRNLLLSELTEFYSKHADLVMESMQISKASARGWCDSQISELETNPGSLDMWVQTKPAELVEIAIGQGR